jgi:hypothetical protein
MNQMKTLQSYQGANTARRAEENAMDKASHTRKSDAFINPSDHTLATFRGADKEYIEDEGTVKMSDEWKGHEKRKIIEKFLSKDEIFFKILQLIPTSISESYKRASADLNSPPTSSQRTTRENKRYIQSNLEFSSPRDSFQTTTNNTNINFYINTQNSAAPDS